jgi:hypothetical protein
MISGMICCTVVTSVTLSPSVLHFLGPGSVRYLKNLVIVFGGLWIGDFCCQCVIHHPWYNQFEPNDVTTEDTMSGMLLSSLYTTPSAAVGMLRLAVAELRFACSVVLHQTFDVDSHFCTKNVLWAACSGPRCGENAGSCNSVSVHSGLGLRDVGGMIENCDFRLPITFELETEEGRLRLWRHQVRGVCLTFA